MGYIPEGAEWYLANLVESLSVRGDARIVVHINSVLVHADSPDEAYSKALDIGRSCRMRYQNRDGRRVVCRFEGVSDLNVIHDALEHGVELAYRRRVVRSRSKVKAFVQSKGKLGVFAPMGLFRGPNYVEGKLWRELEALRKANTATRRQASARPRRNSAKPRAAT